MKPNDRHYDRLTWLWSRGDDAFIHLLVLCLIHQDSKTMLLDTNKLSNGKPQRKNVDGHAGIYINLPESGSLISSLPEYY